MTDESRSGDAVNDRTGFIGLGILRPARAGFTLTVWNRSAGPAAALVELGATEAPSPAEVARRSDDVVTCLTDSPHLEAVLFGTVGVAEELIAGSLVIDCSTLRPVKTIEFAQRLATLDISMLDAPVSGGSEGAKNATLAIFVGGHVLDVARGNGVLAAHGKDGHPHRSPRSRPMDHVSQSGDDREHVPERRRGSHTCLESGPRR